MPCYWHQVAKHYMRDWQFVIEIWVRDVFEGFRFFSFSTRIWLLSDTSMNQSAMIINGFPTRRRFATWIARWLGSWVQLLAVQLDMWQRKSWRRNPRSQDTRGKACYDSFLLLQTYYSKRIQGLSYVYDFYGPNGTILFGKAVRSCGACVQSFSIISLSMIQKHTCYMIHPPSAGRGLLCFIKL